MSTHRPLGYRGQSQVYDTDPDTGAFREPYEMQPVREPARARKLHVCAGCHEEIEPGQEATTTVQRGKHVISVTCHPGHRTPAEANTLEDKSWQRADSFYGG